MLDLDELLKNCCAGRVLLSFFSKMILLQFLLLYKPCFASGPSSGARSLKKKQLEQKTAISKEKIDEKQEFLEISAIESFFLDFKIPETIKSDEKYLKKLAGILAENNFKTDAEEPCV